VAVAEHGGTRLHWQEQGEGEPLVLIMGLGGSGRAWWRLLRNLPPTVRAITLDNRGTGASDRVSGRLTMEELVADVRCVMDAAGVERAHVMGVSMGGMVAQRLALDHRDRVASLVLGSTTAVGLRGAPPWRLLGAGALRPLFGPQRTWDLLAPALYAAATLRDRPELVQEDLRTRGDELQDSRTVAAQLLAVAGHNSLGRLGELADLGVTILHGAEDAVVPPARAHELAAAIEGAHLVMIDGCGHMMTTDAELASAAAVLEHLGRYAAALSPQAA